MSDVKFGSWTVAESPITVEYSLVVIEEIRHEVAEGFQRLSRGGIEVGGVLYGTREGRTVRVTAMRPIACEHARGPGFTLSDKDRIALNEQLLRDHEDPHLEGLMSVGWFLSHTRSEITLSETDQELYSIFFSAPWQVTLVIRPGRGGSMRAGFFVREADGTVKSERSYLEFNFPDRLAGVLDRSPDRAPRERPERKVPSFYRAESPAAMRAEAPPVELPEFLQTPGPQAMRTSARQNKWPLVALWVVLVLVGIAGLRYWLMNSTPEPISLVLLEREGQLQISWNQKDKPVANAVRGSLEIMDGPETRTISLNKAQLASGRATYVRKNGDVEVRMSVEGTDGAKTEGATRFLGPAPVAGAKGGAVAAPASGEDLSDLQRRRDQLEAEVARLRRENGAQAAKIQQLDRTLRVLQTRLGIDQGK